MWILYLCQNLLKLEVNVLKQVSSSAFGFSLVLIEGQQYIYICRERLYCKYIRALSVSIVIIASILQAPNHDRAYTVY